jgi:hypothetical protein
MFGTSFRTKTMHFAFFRALSQNVGYSQTTLSFSKSPVVFGLALSPAYIRNCTPIRALTSGK